MKPDNLIFRSGTAVIMQGLERAPELNGQRGIVQSFDGERRRYKLSVKDHVSANGRGSVRLLSVKLGSCKPESMVQLEEKRA
eukprot:COSAG01_NODE_1096_length_11713_cov_213.007060_12_plen_82_part_00